MDGATDVILECVEARGWGGRSNADGFFTAVYGHEKGGRGLDRVLRTKWDMCIEQLEVDTKIDASRCVRDAKVTE